VTSSAATLTVNVPTQPASQTVDGHLLGHRNRYRSAQLSVAEKWRQYLRCHSSQLQHSGDYRRRQRCAVHRPDQQLTGSVTITSNASNSPLTISVSGTGVVVTHSATLSWTASTSVVVGYNAYRSSISGGPYTKLNSAPDASTTFTDSSVVSGQTYYYVVTAVDSNNVESVYSNQATAVIP
jgi:hypothetical protein